MKYFMKLLWMFIPREGEGDGDGAGGDGGDSGGDGTGDSGGSTDNRKPLGGDDPDRKPDWVADKFWNPDTKTVRNEPLHKAYNELEGKMRGKGDELKEEIRAEMIAAAPDKYEVNLADDLKIPEGVELDFGDDDPLVKWFFGVAKEQGMSQDTVDKMLNEYVGIELGNMTDVAAEIGKLGDHGQDRMLRVHNWLETKLSTEHFQALNPLLSSAMQIEALETLMKTAGPSDFDGDGGGPALTLDELREMQDDPRYHREKNAAFIKKVTDGYARLYKGQ